MGKRKATLSDENKENEGVEPKKIKNNKTVSRTLKDINNNIFNEIDYEAETVAISKIEKLQKVKELLKEIDSSSYTSVSGEASELNTDIKLIAKKCGCIQLPLYETQAEQLMKVCKQVPCGQEFETLFDAAVRDTFQLEPNEFEISNEDWNRNLSKLVKRVAKQLGCKRKITANLHKLVLYKKGALFKKHMDKKNEKDMFGTLIIQLPSIFTGGELVFYEGDDKKIVNYAESLIKDSNKVYYAAHYADVEHAMSEVKTGYRLALVYNLCWTQSNQSYIDSLTDKMALNLSELNGSSDRIGFFLNHRYKGREFETYGLKALKGIDNDRYNLIKNASDKLSPNKQLNFFTLSVYLEISTAVNQKFGPEVNRINVYEYETKVDQLYDSRGNLYGKKELKFELNDFLEIVDLNKPVDEAADLSNCKLWGSIVSQEEEHDENEEPVLKTLYQTYMLVIMPKQDEAESKTSIRFLAETLLSSLKMNQISKENVQLVEYFKSFSELVISNSVTNTTKIYFNDDHNLKIIYILLKMDDTVLVRELMPKINLEFSKTFFNIYAKIIQKYGYENLKESLKIHIKSNSANLQLIHDFLKILMDLKECQMAKIFFGDFILPILNSDVIHLDVDNCILFFSSIMYFENEPDYQQLMKKLNNLIVSKLNNNYYDELLEKLIQKCESFRTNELILDLFRHHLGWLDEKIGPFSEFSWRMPNARIPDHQLVEDFLKSDQQNMTYSNFKSSKDVSRFIKTNFTKNSNFSVEIEVGDRGKEAFVEIRKTVEWHNNKIKQLSQYFKMKKKFKELNLNL